MRSGSHETGLGPVGLLDPCANVVQAHPRVVHLHRVTRDIQADRSTHAVRFPRGGLACRVPRLDEAIIVADVPALLASAEARHVMQNIRTPRGEFVHRPHGRFGTRERVVGDRQRRYRAGVGPRRADGCGWSGRLLQRADTGRTTHDGKYRESEDARFHSRILALASGDVIAVAPRTGAP
jgi:hypothetical protein